MSTLVLPQLPGMTFPVQKTPLWKTKTLTATSGREYRAGYWSYPQWRYRLKYNFLRSEAEYQELQDLLGFFNRHRGALDSWLFDDPDDNRAQDQVFATGDGVQQEFQLVRSYGGSIEPIFSPKDDVSILVDNSQTTATIDRDTGVVQFTSAPANGTSLSWSGGYYHRCRFSEDTVEVEAFMQKLWSLKALEFVTVKP